MGPGNKIFCYGKGTELADIDEFKIFCDYTIYIMLYASLKIKVHDREAWCVGGFIQSV